MSMTLFFACSLAGLGLVLGRFFSVPWCGPFLAVCLTACVELPAAMGGVYHEVRLILACLSLVGAAVVLWRQLADWQRGKSCVEEILPSLLFLWLLCFFYWHYAAARLTYWDEFFWGGFVKHLVQENSLWDWSSVLPRRDSVLLYPPMVTLLQSLLQPAGTYSESAIALGEAAVLLSCAGVVVHVARQRLSPAASCLIALIAFCLFRALGTTQGRFASYLFAYGDSLQLSLYASLGLLLCYSKERKIGLLFAGGLPLLILCKASGVLLALCLWGAWALQVFFTRNKETLCLKLWRAGGVALPAICFWLLWRLYMELFITSGIPPAAASFHAGWETLWKVCLAYVQAFWGRDTMIIPYWGSVLVVSRTIVLLMIQMLIFGMCWRKLKASFRLHNKIAVIVLFAGFWGWILAHIYVTVFCMSPEEQSRAASFERYIPVALGPLLLSAFCCLLEQGEAGGKRLFRKGMICITIALFLSLSIWGMLPTKGLPPSIASVEQAAGLLRRSVPAGASYWLVTGQKDYVYANACQYFLMPDYREAPVENRFRFNSHGSPETALLAGTLPMPLKERVQEQKVDYLLLWNWPADFLERYGALLGLGKDVHPPVLLRLDNWRQGKVPFPERCPLPASGAL